jgi:uncharacterized membrane protein YgcG
VRLVAGGGAAERCCDPRGRDAGRCSRERPGGRRAGRGSARFRPRDLHSPPEVAPRLGLGPPKARAVSARGLRASRAPAAPRCALFAARRSRLVWAPRAARPGAVAVRALSLPARGPPRLGAFGLRVPAPSFSAFRLGPRAADSAGPRLGARFPSVSPSPTLSRAPPSLQVFSRCLSLPRPRCPLGVWSLRVSGSASASPSLIFGPPALLRLRLSLLICLSIRPSISVCIYHLSSVYESRLPRFSLTRDQGFLFVEQRRSGSLSVPRTVSVSHLCGVPRTLGPAPHSVRVHWCLSSPRPGPSRFLRIGVLFSDKRIRNEAHRIRGSRIGRGGGDAGGSQQGGGRSCGSAGMRLAPGCHPAAQAHAGELPWAPGGFLQRAALKGQRDAVTSGCGTLQTRPARCGVAVGAP